MKLDRRIEPFVLLYLLQQPFHGFDLYKKLDRALKGVKIDTAGVYRALDKLVDNNQITFKEVEGDKGPSKKVYEILPEGVKRLNELYEAYRNDLYNLTIFTETYKGLASKM